MPVPLDPGAPGTGGVHDLNTGVLKAEAAVDGWYPLLTSVPAGQADAGHALIPLDVVSFGESAEADEAAGNGGEGQEVLGLAFVA
ncbi:hypothetical protein PV416_28120, partial [Streptomyces ipomoeae]|uniref:hypothetical protein n=1 Tax=Streptomyces ipomoeae TaxID=103232 RepID=UPI0029BCE67B